MATPQAQQSEAHDTTADASTSPVAAGDEQATRQRGSAPSIHVPIEEIVVPAPLSAGTGIVQDDTDVGGPLVIVSDDPALNPPRIAADPFPTDGTPQVDPPIKPES